MRVALILRGTGSVLPCKWFTRSEIYTDEAHTKNIVYSFSSEQKEILELSKSFLTLSVDAANGYTSFDKYAALLAEVIEKIKDKSPYFHALRTGLRKINICYLEDLQFVENYFTSAAFNTKEILSQFKDYECNAYNMVSVLYRKGYQINYTRNIQAGVMEQDDGQQNTMYQLILDIDVLNEDRREIAKMLFEKDSIEKALETQNEIEFDVFIKSLTSDFINGLQQEIFIDNNIEGVI